MVDPRDVERELGNLANAIRDAVDSDAVGRQYERAASALLAPMLDNPNGALADERAEGAGFRARLAGRWGRALDLFELALVAAHQAGDLAHDTYFGITGREWADARFEALTFLFARASMTALEVHTLLSAGLSTGAYTRWRTLHELWVIADILSDNDEELSRRYLSHLVTEEMRAEEDYETSWRALGEDAPPGGRREERELLRAELVQEFDEAFPRPYGWAAPLFNGHAPRYSQLQSLASLDHWKVAYRLASHGTHANSKGILWSVQTPGFTRQLGTGASNAGLQVPAESTLIALTNMIILFLGLPLELALQSDEHLESQVVLLLGQVTSVQLMRVAIDEFNSVATNQIGEDDDLVGRVRQVVDALRVEPSLTKSDIAARVDLEGEDLVEAIAAGERRGYIVADTKYSAAPTQANDEDLG